MATYHGVGVMSGSSLDGLDICLANFTGDVNYDIWGYNIVDAETVPYTDEWRERLGNATELSGLELIRLHHEYGRFLGEQVRDFLQKKHICKVDFVACHGHTVFHQPENGFTFQMGEGETMAALLPCPVITNFRAKDVALGGQGAPLAPSGERFLFHDAHLCLNLGGIANVGHNTTSQGFDICPCNTVLNRLASTLRPDWQFDRNGELARTGQVNEELLSELEGLEFYSRPPPKSLGIEWISANVFPLIDKATCSVEDKLRTFVEHIVRRVTAVCEEIRDNSGRGTASTLMATGGGAFNLFLMERLKASLASEGISVIATDPATVNFKEALIFAFLGLRGMLGMDNVFCQVTGSSADSCSGCIHRPQISNAKFSHRHFHAISPHQQSSLD